MKSPYMAVTDTHQAFDIALNGALKRGTPGVRQSETATNINGMPSTYDGFRIQINRTYKLRQWSKYDVLVNNGTSDTTKCFDQYATYIDADGGTIVRIDDAGHGGAQVITKFIPVPDIAPPDDLRSVMQENQSLRDGIMKGATQLAVATNQVAQQAKSLTTVQKQFADSEGVNRKLSSDLQIAQNALANQPTKTIAVAAVSPWTQTTIVMAAIAASITLVVCISVAYALFRR